ncbi:Serine/threonine-protein phosphatase 7 [Cocos nucifera]|uniref:Serine/threonine-protein phosphatase n=1 Tax=Cocos nucifera TaxID=13894 RepID=A0A8K0IIU9_COCNU|nr:Serine/threonine-protein phosphatase 7 [Cocos nucifera]
MSTKQISNPDLSSSATEATTPSPPSPPGITLSWPADGILTVEWIRALTAALDWASRHIPPSDLPSVLPFPVFHRLVLAASNILHKERNCVTVDVCDESCSVVVVGDVHGQLHDVIFLLEDAGFPSEDRFFVFNGDYVDRGAWGLETFVLLLAWKVFLPHRVFLLRGNHESKYCTSVYGFEKEVMVKYGDQGQQVYRKCLRCFEGLPLASIIAGCVYTAHGGLFRSMNLASSKRSKGKKGRKVVTNVETNLLKLGSLEELQNARRTVLDPPWEGSNLIPGDVLWSDPSLKPGISPNKERGIGLLWGPDCTEEFLKKYNLKLIIRSHEGPDARDKRHDLTEMNDGYTIDHTVESGKLITLFSAPDYPQFQDGLKKGWMEKEGWMRERMDGGSIHPFICLVKHGRMDRSDFLLCLATEERFNNRGAYIVLHSPDFTSPEFHTFEAIKPRPQANAYYDFEEVIDSDEELDLQSMDHGSALEGITAIQTE